MSIRTHPPKSRLSILANHFSSLNREKVIEAAMRELETMRSDSEIAVCAAIAQLEDLAGGASAQDDVVLMSEMQLICDQVITLAGTFDHHALDKATRSLCDLIDGLLGHGKSDLASIRVHIQTMHMLAPGPIQLSKDKIEVMLLELRKLLDFHGFNQTGPR